MSEIVTSGVIWPDKKQYHNQMWFKLLYYRIWIRDVFWLGPPAPKVLGSDSKHISNSDVAPF